MAKQTKRLATNDVDGLMGAIKTQAINPMPLLTAYSNPMSSPAPPPVRRPSGGGIGADSLYQPDWGALSARNQVAPQADLGAAIGEFDRFAPKDPEVSSGIPDEELERLFTRQARTKLAMQLMGNLQENPTTMQGLASLGMAFMGRRAAADQGRLQADEYRQERAARAAKSSPADAQKLDLIQRWLLEKAFGAQAGITPQQQYQNWLEQEKTRADLERQGAESGVRRELGQARMFDIGADNARQQRQWQAGFDQRTPLIQAQIDAANRSNQGGGRGAGDGASQSALRSAVNSELATIDDELKAIDADLQARFGPFEGGIQAKDYPKHMIPRVNMLRDRRAKLVGQLSDVNRSQMLNLQPVEMQELRGEAQKLIDAGAARTMEQAEGMILDKAGIGGLR